MFSLEEFTKAWNKHPIRTVNNWTPYKIWINGTISMNDEDVTNISEMEEFGVDEEGPLPEEQLNTVVVPDTLSEIDNNVLDIFVEHLKQAAPSVFSYEMDYITEFSQAKEFLMNLL